MTGRLTRILAAVAVVAAVVTTGASPAAADEAVNGSGSTFAAIMIDQWRADAAQQLGIRVNFNPTGSTTGRTQFAQNTVDWASSDISYMPADVFPSRAFDYMPLVAGGTSLMYNVRDGAGRPIDGLRLSGDLVAKIFAEEITNWRDPAILALNADNGVAARLPDREIRPTVRAEGSGTTAVFMQYLASAAPDVMARLRNRFAGEYRTPDGTLWTDTWPGNVAGGLLRTTRATGSYALATVIANVNSNGSIGYAEAGYALAAGLPMAFVQNAAGNFTLPTPRNVAVALLEATRNSDGTQNLSSVFTNGRPEAYAISSYNYAIVPTTGFNPDKGSTLGKYLIHSLTVGQSKAATLGYSPLPPNLVQQGFDVIRQIPGAPDPGPLGDWGKDYLALDVGTIQRPGSGGVQGPGAGGAGAGANQRANTATTAGSTSTTAPDAAAAAAAAAASSTDPAFGDLAAGDLSRGSREALTAKFELRDGKVMIDGKPIGTPRRRGVVIYLVLAAALVALAIGPPLAMGWIGPRRRPRPPG
ncbi:MAG TPA: substrate-binding domain-containing protein [Acidimicrobiales bacterium]